MVVCMKEKKNEKNYCFKKRRNELNMLMLNLYQKITKINHIFKISRSGT